MELPELSVVMPAHNEERYIRGAADAVLTGLRGRRRPFEVLLVENGSSDSTATVAAAIAGEEPEVKALQLPFADYGQALRAGFLAARGELVVNFDVDFVDLAFLEAAIAEQQRQNAAIVVGSKRTPGSDDLRAPGRKFVTAVFSAVLRLAFGLRVSDTHGLKLLRRAPLVELVASSKFGGDIFDTELVIRAERAGLGVTEIPVTVVEQRPPRTSILRRIPRSLLGLAKLRISLWARRQQGAPAAAQRSPERTVAGGRY